MSAQAGGVKGTAGGFCERVARSGARRTIMADPAIPPLAVLRDARVPADTPLTPRR